jgi:aquaporin Z
MMRRALRQHWPEYLLEAAELALLMVAAGTFTTFLEWPGSPARQAIADPFLRRTLIGLAMGLTAIGLIFSPLGKRSGAHMNPAVTLTFLRLGKIRPWDALFYIVAQFAGGAAGIALAAWLMHDGFALPPVNHLATVPGPSGAGVAFVAEFVISFVLMLTVLTVSNTPKLARWTGVFAGALVASYITFEAPLSGMSMNPARTLGSAVVAWLWTGLWVYFTAPVLAMLLAAEVHVRSRRAVYCAKLHHHNGARCIFNCEFRRLLEQEEETR